MKTRYWGIFKQQWYSFCSAPYDDKCEICQNMGKWRNQILAEWSKVIYLKWPKFWIWWVNISK